MQKRQNKISVALALGPALFNVNGTIDFRYAFSIKRFNFIPWIFLPIVTTAFNYDCNWLAEYSQPKLGNNSTMDNYLLLLMVLLWLASSNLLGGLLQLLDYGPLSELLFPFLEISLNFALI